MVHAGADSQPAERQACANIMVCPQLPCSPAQFDFWLFGKVKMSTRDKLFELM